MNHTVKIHLVEIENLLGEKNFYKIPDNEFVAWMSQHATVMVTRIIVDGMPWSNLRVEEYRDRRYYKHINKDDAEGQFVKAYLERIDAAKCEFERDAIRYEYRNCDFNRPIFNPFTLKSIHRRKNWRPDFHIDPIRFNSEFKQFYGYLNN
jgi:hypothetical protein